MSNEVAIVGNSNNPFDAIANPQGQLFTTLDMSTIEGQDAIFAALTAAEPVSDHLGEVFNLRHVVAQVVQIENPATKNMVDAVRTILVDDEGVCWTATSEQIQRGLGVLFGIYGRPESWSEAKPIVIRQQKSRNGFNFYNVLPARYAEQVK